MSPCYKVPRFSFISRSSLVFIQNSNTRIISKLRVMNNVSPAPDPFLLDGDPYRDRSMSYMMDRDEKNIQAGAETVHSHVE